MAARNFRSLESTTVEFNPNLNVLVGANGSGKSAILRAIDIVCGLHWPSLRSLRVPQDWTRFEDQDELLIRIGFTEPLTHRDKAGKEHAVLGFQVRCKPYKRKTGKALPGDPNFDFFPYDEKGEQLKVALEPPREGQRLAFAPMTSVPSALRDEARVLFIDHRRSLFQHQPWSRGSVLARLLTPAKRELDRVEFQEGITHGEAFHDRYQAAVEALRTPTVTRVEEVVSETARRTLGFMGKSAMQDLDIRFGFADPANPFGSLRLNYREQGMDLPAESLGLGVQSAIVVGIFEAFRELGGDFGAVLIEEPEMYLHPQAQRYFYGLLCELADSGSCQIICATHSPVFADASRFEGVRLVRRPLGKSTKVQAVKKPKDIEWLTERREAQKLLTLTTARSEVFFAKRVLLVEGSADVLAVRSLAQALGHNLDGEDLAVVECSGKSGIAFIGRICKALGIPALAMHDEDLHEPAEGSELLSAQRKENEREKKVNAEIAEVFESAEIFRHRPSLEAELDIGRNAKDKPRRVAETLTSLAAPDYPPQLIAAVEGLLSEPIGPTDSEPDDSADRDR